MFKILVLTMACILTINANKNENNNDLLLGSWSLDKNTPILKKWDPYKLQYYYPKLIFSKDSNLFIESYSRVYYTQYLVHKNTLLVATIDTAKQYAIIHKLKNDSMLISNFLKCKDTVLYIKNN